MFAIYGRFKSGMHACYVKLESVILAVKDIWCTVCMHKCKSACVTMSVVTGPYVTSLPHCSHSPTNGASGNRAKGTHQVHPTGQALWK